LSRAGVYTRLGVRPLINGMGTVTMLGGSLMPPEVVRAMEEAARFFVDLPELQKKVGERIAEVIGVPGAMVTAGAASAITVATAACVTRGDRDRYARLPDATGMPNEVIQQKKHRSGYEAQIRLVGASVIEVETRDELERAIGPRTAMLFYLNRADADGRIGRQEWIEVARARGVAAFNDAAADVPPPSRLASIVKEGFDLVAFSGGKGLRGPQCSGLLLGRKDLIEAAAPAISPHGGIGRGMKVGKEELIGLLAAVERYLHLDQATELRLFETRVADIIRALSGVPGLRAERHVPKIANEVPHASVTWDEANFSLTAQEVLRQLREGEPPIAVLGSGPGQLLISVWTMQGDEHRAVARRLREILQAAGTRRA
jgi:L-seryl-tRNA(Ser) seleniumtransferase